MNKNTVLAIVCSAVVLIAYTVIQTKFFPVQKPLEQSQTIEQESSDDNETQKDTTTQTEIVEKVEGIDDVSQKETFSEQNYVISTNKIKVVFTNRGGDVISYELIDHLDNKTKKGVEMADNISKMNRAFSVSFGDANKNIINDLFVVKEFPVSADGEQKIAFIRNYSDFTLIKQYTFLPDEYMFKLNIFVDGSDSFTALKYETQNNQNASYTVRTSPQVGPFFDTKVDRYESRSFLTHTDGKGKRVRLSTKQFKAYNKSYEWAGIGGKYFCELIIPQKPETMTEVYYSTNFEIGTQANAQALLVRKPILDKQTNDVYYVYVGPRSEKELKKYSKSDTNAWKLENLRLTDALESSGFFGWIEAILKFVMELIYKVIPNWGVSIIILTLIIKLAMFPLTMKSSLGTLKMQELQPRMQAIQTKYKDQPEKMQQETMKIYQEVGYNPMSGCLPMILQMLFLFAMYNLFNNYFEFRGSEFVKGWIDDLSSGDSIYMFKFNIPFLGNHLRLLPIIYLVSQLLYGKITQLGASVGAGANSGQMKFMNYGLPFIFFFMFYNAPAGLLLYWTVSNIFQMGQQIVTNKIMAKKKAEKENVVQMPKKTPPKSPKGKSGKKHR